MKNIESVYKIAEIEKGINKLQNHKKPLHIKISSNLFSVLKMEALKQEKSLGNFVENILTKYCKDHNIEINKGQ